MIPTIFFSFSDSAPSIYLQLDKPAEVIVMFLIHEIHFKNYIKYKKARYFQNSEPNTVIYCPWCNLLKF